MPLQRFGTMHSVLKYCISTVNFGEPLILSVCGRLRLAKGCRTLFFLELSVGYICSLSLWNSLCLFFLSYLLLLSDKCIFFLFSFPPKPPICTVIQLLHNPASASISLYEYIWFFFYTASCQFIGICELPTFLVLWELKGVGPTHLHQQMNIFFFCFFF